MLRGGRNKKILPINFNPKVVSKTQNLKPVYMSNGSFFIFRKKTFKKYNNRIGKNPYYYELKFPKFAFHRLLWMRDFACFRAAGAFLKP